jgi:hypothetical protein
VFAGLDASGNNPANRILQAAGIAHPYSNHVALIASSGRKVLPTGHGCFLA